MSEVDVGVAIDTAVVLLCASGSGVGVDASTTKACLAVARGRRLGNKAADSLLFSSSFTALVPTNAIGLLPAHAPFPTPVVVVSLLCRCCCSSSYFSFLEKDECR